MSRGKTSARPGQIRIIGGRWRRHRIALPDDDRIRPTGDRVRETLFNWLMPIIEGARCLDLFAGSGALGLEGLSRGAGQTVFVELDPAAANRLDVTLEQLQCRDATVVNGDARRFLGTAPTPFDIVWLDPPFGEFDLANLCTLLERGWLAPRARIYLELSRHKDLPELPSGWVIDRDKTAGQVRFALARRA
ncbi:MAG: 16S rRNA (guanine(966)-N(2))-methyltransferase RsmD [Gammaproteobacteria bacterium]|nr:MAG: 16S rRNA (guanine(966)-N(2))-methyltransferase RsmD [Gammaproteobacteria bacterium]